MKVRILLFLLLVSLVPLFGSCSPFGSDRDSKAPRYAKKDIERKIENLLSRMTIEEKVGQMAQYDLHGKITDEKLEQVIADIREGKVGSYLNLTNAVAPELRNMLQKVAVEQSRLGIPLIFGFDVIHGYRTVFPIPLGQSCSWEPALAEKAASIAALEASAAGHDWTFAPMIDIARDPRWGRIAEGFGEDPFLCSAFAAAKVRGFQGTNIANSSSLVACLKHYAAYGAAEGGRDYNTSDISKRTLREVYLPPFKAGVEAGAGTLMSAFNEISGIPCTANHHILTEILRDEWQFDGFVISDYSAVNELVKHGFAKDPCDAGAKAVTAGVDMFMESLSSIEQLPALVKNGTVSEKVIDQAVRRILRIKFCAGLFDNPYVDPNRADSVILADEHIRFARELARNSMVLLKNEGNLLPLKTEDIETLGLIGPLADNQKDLLGTWAGAGDPNDVVTVLAAIKQKLPSEAGTPPAKNGVCHPVEGGREPTKLLYAKGCDVDGNSILVPSEVEGDGFAEAIEVAMQSDLVILAIGESPDHSGEAHSRAYLGLPGVQSELVKAIRATGKPVIVVLFTGRPLATNWVSENIPAILVAWHPGIQGGSAIADILFGDYNPSGKLTTTFPRTVGQVPIYYNHKNTGRPPTEKERYTSKYIDVHWSPLFVFGYGLSYTTFEYSNLRLSAGKVKMGEPLTVTADVQNTGDRKGQEIVQLYIRDLVGSVTRPVKQLKGFEKISLEPGEKKTVSFTVTDKLLSFYNDRMQYVVEPGEFKVWVGPDSVSGLQASFEVLPP